MEGNICIVNGYPVATGDQIDTPWVRERFDYFGRDKYSCKVMKFRPEDFLFITTEPQYDKEIIKELREKIRNHCPLDVPWIEVEIKNPRDPLRSRKVIYSHEGRHRARASIEEGLKTIPVLWCERGI